MTSEGLPFYTFTMKNDIINSNKEYKEVCHMVRKILSIFLCAVIVFLSLIPSYIPQVQAASYPTYGVVNFRTKSCNATTSYTTEDGYQGYTNGCSGADAAFLGIENGKVKFKLSGVVGYVDPSEVEVRNMDPETPTTYISNYRVENGELKHYIQEDVNTYASVGIITIGPAPSYLSEGIYYSYDGIYFYDDTLPGLKSMIDDYKSGGHSRAINANDPYYNYYLYLPARTLSNYTSSDLAVDFSSYTSKVTGLPAASHESQLYGEEISFIEYQGEYGVNAMMALGVAKNESRMGQSTIAYNKNNIFGIAVRDENTSAGQVFPTVRASIRAFYKTQISEGYLDPLDRVLGGRYYGGHFGNKASGFNVKYASDPYWGEKEASYYYNFDKAYGSQDYNKYTIGIKSDNGNYDIKKEPSSSSTTLYKTTKNRNLSFVILDTITNNEGTWYKIQTDPTLADGRNSIRQDQGAYDFNQNYGYISSDVITYISNGKDMKTRYAIDFDPNGGTFIDGETTTKRITVEEYVVPDIADPKRDGYTFAGWNEEVMAAQENKTYVAVWKSNNPEKYTITFDANGGTFSNGKNTISQTVEEGDMPKEPETPTREGYQFIGWDSNISLVTGNKTYKAVWEKEKEVYEITFDANGGVFENGEESTVVKTTEGELPTVPDDPTKEGNVFQGWDKEISSATGNTTYQAVWKELFDITFDANEGKFENGKQKETIEVLDGELPNTPSDPTREGYRFTGWEPTITTASKDQTYQATWEKVKTYAITFDADGGTFENGKDQITIYVEENTLPSITNPIKDGYLFQGWDKELTSATEDTTYQAVWKEWSIEDLEESSANFYLEYLKEEDGKLKIKGYQTINGIDHTLDQHIEYDLLLQSMDDETSIYLPLNRIENENDLGRPAIGSDQKDYTYSWFEGTIDISKVQNGDYKLYVVAHTEDTYSKHVVNNLLYKEQANNYEQSGKYALIRTDVSDDELGIEMQIRSEELGKKETSYLYAQYDQFREMSFQNGKLNILGYSYSYGTDYGINADVKRTMIFENVDTYEKYEFEIGSVTDGLFTVTLPTSDGYDKTRAWYRASIDLKELEKGRYAIYISNHTNVSDFGELKDLLYKDLSSVKTVIGGKEYQFIRNDDLKHRIELIVE